MDILSEARRIVQAQVSQTCRCATREYPHFDPECENPLHWTLAALDGADPIRPSSQGDGDPGPMRMTLAEPTTQTVWLLWRNDRCLAVYGHMDRARKDMHELMEAIGGVWRHA